MIMRQSPILQQTLLRVADVDAAAQFYLDGFGMEILDRTDGTDGISAFVGFAGGDTGAAIELRATGDAEDAYTHGTGYGHVAVGIENVSDIFAKLEAMDAGVILSPGIVTPGGPVCAFVKDRDGYAVEIVETKNAKSEDTGFDPKGVILGPADGKRRILHTMLRIADVDASLRFYVDGLGMELLERIDIDTKGGVTGLFVGFDRRDAGHQLELSCYRAAEELYTHGTGFGHISIEAPDRKALLQRLDARAISYEWSDSGWPPRVLVKDPDGYGFEIVQAELH